MPAGTKRVKLAVVNSSTRDITIRRDMEIGRLFRVQSVTPMPIKPQTRPDLHDSSTIKINRPNGQYVDITNNNSNNGITISTAGAERHHTDIVSAEHVTDGNCDADSGSVGESVTNKADGESIVDKILIDPTLSEEDVLRIRKMLWEERDVFSSNEQDHGDFRDLEMKIHLTDDIPVKVNYSSIPKPLYTEVKTHLQDLIN